MEMNRDPARACRCAPILHGERGIGTAFEQPHIKPQEVEGFDVGHHEVTLPATGPTREVVP
jgi:hypothetical protein